MSLPISMFNSFPIREKPFFNSKFNPHSDDQSWRIALARRDEDLKQK